MLSRWLFWKKIYRLNALIIIYVKCYTSLINKNKRIKTLITMGTNAQIIVQEYEYPSKKINDTVYIDEMKKHVKVC